MRASPLWKAAAPSCVLVFLFFGFAFGQGKESKSVDRPGFSGQGKESKPIVRPGFSGQVRQSKSVNQPHYSGMGELAERARNLIAANGGIKTPAGKSRRVAHGAATAASGGDTQGLGCDLSGDCESGDDFGSANQAELSVAVDPTGMHVVIGFNDFRGFNVSPTSVSGYAYSDDGGVTFTDGGQLPSPGTDVIGATKFPQNFGDPSVHFVPGTACTFLYFEIEVIKFSATGTAQTMGFHRSTDCGHTWSGPFIIPPATNPHGLLSGANARDAADKEFADADLDTGRVLMSWSNFTSTAFAPGGVEISTTYSDNILDATPTWSPRVIVSATAADGQASIPRFAGNGSPNAWVCWRRFPGGNNQNVGCATSGDNGASFSAPMNTTTNFFTMDQVLGNDRVNTSPSLAVDNSLGTNSGALYLAYTNNNNHDGGDIAFQKSTDGGMTWSPAILLNARPGSDGPQWFPWVSVDSITGRVDVFWDDQQIAGTGDLMEMLHTYSVDGGATWSKPVPLSNRPFHAGWGNDTSQPNLGDYNQSVALNGKLYAAYALASRPPGGFVDGEPTSGSFTVPAPAVALRSDTTLQAALDLGVTSFTESGGNGLVDAGDLVKFTVPLKNYVTNPLTASTVTGISATLGTATPNVAILLGSSSYPGIVPGAMANNNTKFVVQVSPSFVPGTPIEFALNVMTGEGPTTLRWTQVTGTPMMTTIFSENFDGVAPGSLPAGWLTSHAGGSNIVPWRTSNTFCGTGSNGAFHQNAADGLSTFNNTRFERLFSPLFAVPSSSGYVSLDMDICYDTEDDPAFNVQAFDGFTVRITDQTPGHIIRSVFPEAFQDEFTTDSFNFHNKHLPRNSSSFYFQDISAWGGTSMGMQHVHMKLPGMAGTTAQLRFEYTQDSFGICSDVRPGDACGVFVDNIVLRSVTLGSFDVKQLKLTPVVGTPGLYSGVVTLQAPAPAGGLTVALASSRPDKTTLPASVFIAAGATTSPAFAVQLDPTFKNVIVNITASPVLPAGSGPAGSKTAGILLK